MRQGTRQVESLPNQFKAGAESAKRDSTLPLSSVDTPSPPRNNVCFSPCRGSSEVERGPEKAGVGGSIPSPGTIPNGHVNTARCQAGLPQTDSSARSSSRNFNVRRIANRDGLRPPPSSSSPISHTAPRLTLPSIFTTSRS